MTFANNVVVYGGNEGTTTVKAVLSFCPALSAVSGSGTRFPLFPSLRSYQIERIVIPTVCEQWKFSRTHSPLCFVDIIDY